MLGKLNSYRPTDCTHLTHMQCHAGAIPQIKPNRLCTKCRPLRLIPIMNRELKQNLVTHLSCVFRGASGREYKLNDELLSFSASSSLKPGIVSFSLTSVKTISPNTAFYFLVPTSTRHARSQRWRLPRATVSVDEEYTPHCVLTEQTVGLVFKS